MFFRSQRRCQYQKQYRTSRATPSNKNWAVGPCQIPYRSCQMPLHLAAKEGRRAVQFLIEQGANINCTDRKGKTPAALAKKAGHAHLLQYLKMVHERQR